MIALAFQVAQLFMGFTAGIVVGATFTESARLATEKGIKWATRQHGTGG